MLTFKTHDPGHETETNPTENKKNTIKKDSKQNKQQ